MANINAVNCKEEGAELTADELVSPLYENISTLDNDASDTYCSVETEPNISYKTAPPAAKTAPPAAKTANVTRRIAEKEDVSCKRFICILVTITLVTIISLVCLAVLFSQTPSSQDESVFMSQLEQINKSLTSIQDQITTLSSDEMEYNAAQSNNIQQLNTSIDMQLSTLHNQTQQLSDSNIMLQQQLTTLHNQTQQLSDSNIMLQQQLTTLHNQTQQLSDSSTMLQQQLTTLQNQTQQLSDSNTMLQQQLTTQTQQLSDSNTMLQQQLTTLQNQTQQLSDSNTMLQQQLTTLHNQTQQLSDSNTMLQQQLDTALLAGQLSIYPATSCAALPPSSPSGYYWISNSNDSSTLVYCTMSCGTLTGEWTRVAFLDMTNSSHQCPSGLMERNDSLNIRTCVRNEVSAGCSSVELSTANIQYSDVCGRITAYQVGSPDDFRPSNYINSAYVDGVSLTHGNHRQHIWSFAAAGRMDRICDDCRNEPRPGSVGSDFFCDTGNPLPSSTTFDTFYSANPLWDGVGCTADNECCPTDNPPYFLKTLPQHTTDDIEMRVCRNEGRSNEDIAIETVEIYVQ